MSPPKIFELTETIRGLRARVAELEAELIQVGEAAGVYHASDRGSTRAAAADVCRAVRFYRDVWVRCVDGNALETYKHEATRLKAELDAVKDELVNIVADADERVAAAFRVAEVDLKGASWPQNSDHDARALWLRVWLSEQAAKQAQNIETKAQRQRDALRKVVREQADRLCKIPCGNGLYAMDVMISVRALRAALEGK